MNIRPFFKKIHLWLSIPAGLIIVIICLTGSILSFETEILEVYYPERYFVKEIKQQVIPIDQLVPLVNKQLDNNTVSAIKVASDPNRTYTATLSEGFRISAFVDPYTGEVKGIYSFRDSFFSDMMLLHRWLMDGTRTWGKYTVGITTLLFVFILISGIVWWVPKDRKKLKSRFQVKTKSGIKRLLHDLHVSLGIYVCIFLLVCCLTGLMWSFDWYRNGVNKIFGVEARKEESGGGHNKGNDKSKDKGNSKRGNKDEKRREEPINYLSWNTALSNLQKKASDNVYITISNGSATVLDKNAPHLRATDKYTFDASTGEITKTALFADDKSASKIMSWAYALHVGAYGGIVTRILTCLACLIGATMPLTGYYILYIKRRKKKVTKKPSSDPVS